MFGECFPPANTLKWKTFQWMCIFRLVPLSASKVTLNSTKQCPTQCRLITKQSPEQSEVEVPAPDESTQMLGCLPRSQENNKIMRINGQKQREIWQRVCLNLSLRQSVEAHNERESEGSSVRAYLLVGGNKKSHQMRHKARTAIAMINTSLLERACIVAHTPSYLQGSLPLATSKYVWPSGSSHLPPDQSNGNNFSKISRPYIIANWSQGTIETGILTTQTIG